MRFIITVALSLAAFISFAVASPVVTPLEAEAGLVQKRQCTPQGAFCDNGAAGCCTGRCCITGLCC
ncbi:hypothetical protein K435DRAFT_854594 [Dendrothele bispora CBS 962.96]|uniref:Uncharacterized protein n=1 Tax=Dendrothele bispora (strain CBS 962.96) TaxID=1314807 RepID=A0A4S8MF17_DENBC|nr:hypothetical protein K435DRAFT_854594 [Dendrothele bispora CBS 962.96]